MKILMTLMGLEIGGAETHVVELSKELQRQGHTVIIASNGGVYEKALSDYGIRHFKMPMHQRDLGKMLRSLRLLEELIQTEKPDLVHAHARIPAFLCGILHKKMHFPFITSAHWVFQVTPLLRLMTDWGQRTVAVSEDIKTYLMQNYQVPQDQIHVTINGIDTASFAPGPKTPKLLRELGIGFGPIIGTVSRLDESRELAARKLIAIMPQVLKAVPSAQLLIVGGGDMEAILRSEAEAVNRAVGRRAILMTGPRTDIAGLVSLCDIFVGVSRAALEAMAAEKPTILAGNEGYIGPFSPEVLSSAQESNFCCRGFGQTEEKNLISDVLNLLCMDSQRRSILGRFGRKVVLEQYSVARMTRDYLDAYQTLLHPPQVIHAAISGYYGYGNLGDDAILLSISQQLSKADRPVRLTVLSRQPERTGAEYGLKAVHRFSPIGVYRAIRRADVLISGGGSLLQDKTSTRSLLYYLSVIRLAKHLRKPVFLYANGIGPLTHESNRQKVKACIETCEAITLRDTDSLKELRSLGIDRQDIAVTGDPVFTLAPSKARRDPLAELGIPETGQIIGISVRSIPQTDHFTKEFAKLCDRLIRQQGKQIVFLVMQESEDEAISQQIQNLMQERSYLLKAPGDPPSMLAAIGRMQTVISMRLHTIIFAANLGLPVVGCVYDPKVSAILDMLQMPSCGTPTDMDADHAYAVTMELLERMPEYRHRLSTNVARLTPKAEETFRLFQQMLKTHLLLDDE